MEVDSVDTAQAKLMMQLRQLSLQQATGDCRERQQTGTSSQPGPQTDQVLS